MVDLANYTSTQFSKGPNILNQSLGEQPVFKVFQNARRWEPHRYQGKSHSRWWVLQQRNHASVVLIDDNALLKDPEHPNTY